MGHILSHPVTSKNIQRFGDDKGRVAVAEMQGYRTNMEDAHTVMMQLPSHPDIMYIGMFDGHNGSAAAEWMAREMPARLDALSDPCEHKALTACVEQADADFMSDVNVRVHGCTACLVLIKKKEGGKRTLTCANVGDSRCLVFGWDGVVKFTTEDHKPDTESEGARIRAAGGSVSFGRVDGDLAMSRSIGDYAYKNVGHVDALAQKVVPTPDCTDVELVPEDMVIVCCDGLVEKLSNEEVVAHVIERLNAQKRDATDSAAAELDPAPVMCSLLDYSLTHGSKDNMSSALYLPTPSGTNYARADEYAVGPFSEWASDRAFVDAFFADARKHGHTHEEVQQMVATYNAKQQETQGNNSTNGQSKVVLL